MGQGEPAGQGESAGQRGEEEGRELEGLASDNRLHGALSEPGGKEQYGIYMFVYLYGGMYVCREEP